jgi:hypothetical protein
MPGIGGEIQGWGYELRATRYERTKVETMGLSFGVESVGTSCQKGIAP